MDIAFASTSSATDRYETDARAHRAVVTEISSRSWRPALLVPQAEIAETTHTPKSWDHEPLRLVVRGVRIPVDELSEDPRSRRRRTVPAEQVALALKGRVEYG